MGFLSTGIQKRNRVSPLSANGGSLQHCSPIATVSGFCSSSTVGVGGAGAEVAALASRVADMAVSTGILSLYRKY